MIKSFIAAALLMVGSAPVFCQEWLEIADSDASRYDGRAGTRIFATTKSGTPIVVAQGRIFDKQKKTYLYRKWYVSVNDCKTGYGKLVSLSMDGEFIFDTDYVEKGGSIGSMLGDMLCYAVKEQNGKGI